MYRHKKEKPLEKEVEKKLRVGQEPAVKGVRYAEIRWRNHQRRR